MQRILIAVSASLVAGVAAGALFFGSDPELPESRSDRTVSSGNGVAAQIRQLEQDLAAERGARRLLEEQVDDLTERLDGVENAPTRARNRVEDQATRVTSRPTDSQSRVAALIEQTERMREWRLNRFVEGGYTEDEARALMDAESDAQLQSMYDEWDAERQGLETSPWGSMMNAQDILRERLGDTEYERYLRAQGSNASVQVSNVMDRSPGSVAGLQVGDEIVSYNGERTFSVLDLRRLTMQGEPGESVIVEIDREGVRMQLTVPRGPIGINGSGANTRAFGMFGG